MTNGITQLSFSGGVAVALSAVCLPFVTPALRKVCLPFVPATDAQVANVMRALGGGGAVSAERRRRLVDIGFVIHLPLILHYLN